MDDTFQIPAEAKQAAEPDSQTESGEVFYSDNIRAHSDDLHYDQAGYIEALAGNDNNQAHYRQSLKSMVGEATGRLADMEESGYWNENISLHNEIEVTNRLEANLEAWRDSETGSSGEDL